MIKIKRNGVFGFLLVSLLFLILINIAFVSSSVINVCSNCNYTTIQSAINNASSGDTINVSAGTYLENIIINKSLTINGAKSGIDARIRDGTGESVIDSNFADGTIQIQANNVLINGFKIINSVKAIHVNEESNSVSIKNNYISGGNDGVNLWRANSADVEQNYIENILISGITAGDDNGTINTFDDIKTNAVIKNNKVVNAKFGITGYQSGSLITNNEVRDYSADGAGIGGQFINVKIINNSVKNYIAGVGIGLQGYANRPDSSSISVYNNSISNNLVGIFSNQELNGNDIVINYNEIFNNTNNIINQNADILDAEKNWWGECKPEGSKILGAVDYTPWIGVCVTESSVASSCILAKSNLELNANISSNSSLCLGKVIFQVNSNNSLKNYTAISMGNGVYSRIISNFTSGETVKWKIYADDCFNHLDVKDGDDFYVNKLTKLIVNPSAPDGINNSWYVTEPIFSLDNPDASQISYKWDGNGIFSGDADFGLQNTPNGNNTGGILKLTYWSELKCGAIENEQFKTFNFDFYDPAIEPLSPVNNQTLNIKRPQIKISLDDIYSGNSGINTKSIILMVNNNLVANTDYSLSKIGRYIFLTYNPDEDLSEGVNEIYLYVEDNAGRKSQLSWNFKIDSVVPDFNINIRAPMNGDENSRRVKINVSTNRLVDSIEYINNNDRNPRYKVLCRNCNGFGNSRTASINLQEGENNITFRAVDNGNEKKSDVILFIDSKNPKIILTEPKVGASVNGSIFSVKYQEDNLQVVNFYYLDKKINKTECESGKNKVCIFSIPSSELANYSGKYIEYWFEIKDKVNSVSSKKTRVKIDTITPTLNITSPKNLFAYINSQRILFNLSVSEDSLVDYYDNSELNPKWKRLCVKCNKYNSVKLLNKGNHDLLIRATDSAGNSKIEEISFSVL